MKIAIVGTSHLTEDEEERANIIIETILQRAKFKDVIITGDADGIDKNVKWLCEAEQIPHNQYQAKVKGWANENGFKDRNIRMAKAADYIYSITTKTKDEKCYHCGLNHQRTGGCWTLKYARSIGKKGEVIVI